MAFPAFRPEELQIVGWNSPPFGGMPRSPKFNTPITPKENWQLVMEGKKPCWMPFSTDIQGFRPRIIPDNVVCGLVVDGGPPLGVEDYSGKGWFDTEWVYVPMVGGATVKPGAPQIEDINDWPSILRFPDIDAYDWEAHVAEDMAGGVVVTGCAGAEGLVPTGGAEVETGAEGSAAVPSRTR